MNRIDFDKLPDGSYKAKYVAESGYGTESHEGSVINVEKSTLDLGVQYGVLKKCIEIKNRNGGVNNFYIINKDMSLLHIKEDLAIMTDTYLQGRCVGEVLKKTKKTVNLKVSKEDGRVIPNISMQNIMHQNNAGVYVLSRSYCIPYAIAMQLLLKDKKGGIKLKKIVHHIDANWNNMLRFISILSKTKHSELHSETGQSRHDLSVVIKNLGQLQAFIDYMEGR